MPEYASFAELQEQVFKYFETPETLPHAYDLLTEVFPQFPVQANLLYNWRYCAAALMNKTDLALQIMQESLDAGFWWGEDYLRSDTDLASLQDLPEFNRIVEISEQKRLAAQAKTKPLALTLPIPTDATHPVPMLMALHGNTMNAQVSVENWESAVDHGWLTSLLQSSQIAGPDMYVWNDLELGASEINTHYQQLCDQHQVNPAQVVVSGFSKGGEMAIWLTLKEIVPVAGFIVINPGGPLIQDVTQWQPILNTCQTLADLHGFFVVGEKDQNAEKIMALKDMLVSHGMNCELAIAPDTHHDFPANFDHILAKALKFVTQG